MTASLSAEFARPQRLATLSPKPNRLLGAGVVVALHLTILYLLILHTASVHSLRRGHTGAEISSIVEASLYTAPAQKQNDIPKTATASQAGRTAVTQDHVHARIDNQQAAHLATPSQEASDDSSRSAAISGAAVPADLPSETFSDLASDYQRQLLSRIEPHLRYPDEAKAAHPEGVVEIIFALNRDGTVIGAWVKQSSGSTALDKEAIAAIMQAQPLPAIPVGLPSPLNIELPVTFSQHS